jgi:hypothetical protein
MGSEASERVVALLREISGLKELNNQYEANPTESEREAHRLRQVRHEEITQEIKALAEQTKKTE